MTVDDAVREFNRRGIPVRLQRGRKVLPFLDVQSLRAELIVQEDRKESMVKQLLVLLRFAELDLRFRTWKKKYSEVIT